MSFPFGACQKIMFWNYSCSGAWEHISLPLDPLQSSKVLEPRSVSPITVRYHNIIIVIFINKYMLTKSFSMPKWWKGSIFMWKSSLAVSFLRRVCLLKSRRFWFAFKINYFPAGQNGEFINFRYWWVHFLPHNTQAKLLVIWSKRDVCTFPSSKKRCHENVELKLWEKWNRSLTNLSHEHH